VLKLKLLRRRQMLNQLLCEDYIGKKYIYI
jgi:hypothetical protein